MKKLLEEIKQCQLCVPHLELGPRPVVSVSENSKILIIGQAPGTKVHRSGIPWDDQSGENLRNWMGIDSTTFYDNELIGIVPMGFCYPGKGKSGDLPPRKECAPQWHQLLLDNMKQVELTLLIGQYAQEYYLGKKKQKTLTATVKNFKEYLPQFMVLPHPSPRNNIWQAKNPWFKQEVLPELKALVHSLLKS
ncbi:uracil-DNA glycosylase family protein [Flammeovirga pacifica]|uniref:IclR family transcriptional regulator n=1 Tax=Flammeovirga pacifica TaxID=915059 RepID=A0A1S1YUF3_FLAPC|nr:uracil-DNA glycosylase family protein [Flammeovirga pacifica]OHX64651.1 IclR family transcriptional regulator [Flammeovirga pacifica]